MGDFPTYQSIPECCERPGTPVPPFIIDLAAGEILLLVDDLDEE